MSLAKNTPRMGDATLQTRLLIMVMVGIFIGVCIGAVIVVRGNHAQHQVQAPNPFPTTVRQ
jgi:hypothetical protein